MSQTQNLKSLYEQDILLWSKAWQIALKNVRKEYHQITFPPQWTYDRSTEKILNDDFWLELSGDK